MTHSRAGGKEVTFSPQQLPRPPLCWSYSYSSHTIQVTLIGLFGVSALIFGLSLGFYPFAGEF